MKPKEDYIEKKNRRGAKKEKQPDEGVLKMPQEGDGNKTIRIIIYILIVLIILAIIYFLTSYNANTFRINWP